MTRAVWLVVVGIVSVQVGAAFAKDLFGTISPTAIVWLRLVTSALVLTAIARPRLRGPQPRGLAGRGRLRREPGADELGDLPVLRADPAGHRGHHRVHRPAHPGRPRLAPGPRPGLGRPRRPRRAAARLRAGRPDRGGRRATPCSRAPRGRRTSCSAPAPAPAGRDSTAWRSPASWPPCCSPSRRSSPAGTRLLDGRVLLIGAMIGLLSLGHPLQLRDGRAADPAAVGVLDPDEPRARGRRAGRDRGAQRAARRPCRALAIGCVIAASVGATRCRPVLTEPAPD